MDMFWLMNRTEPSHIETWAPPGCELNTQSSLIAWTIVAGVHWQLIGEPVRPLTRTDSSVFGPPIQIGQSSTFVGARFVGLPFPCTYDSTPDHQHVAQPVGYFRESCRLDLSNL